jgi:thermostable 8-oxoguanine DNA glycosylase
MKQIVRGTSIEGVRKRLSLPDPDADVLPGMVWGHCEYLFTPAFWAAHAWQCSLAGRLPSRHRLGSTLPEEVAACILGGYGIPAEVGLEAYSRLRCRGLLNGEASAEELLAVLSEPLLVHGRRVQYRFARQKAAHLAVTLRALGRSPVLSALSDVEFRDWLTQLPGVGLKTASWITRNFRGSNAVAIIDVHVFRAGRLAGLYSKALRIARDYAELERGFLSFASAIGVPASQLDALMWDFMRRVGPLAVSAVDDAPRMRVPRLPLMHPAPH